MIETKEGAALPWPPPPAQTDLETARAGLAAEWQAANPRTPDEVSDFYRQASGIGADLCAWHTLPERQEWTRMLVHVATSAGARRIVDIGAGAGHDLAALKEVLPEALLVAVEPNWALSRALLDRGLTWLGRVDEAPIEEADLLICCDVLEHVVDPETFLQRIAQRAPLGCLLFETTATHDCGTPLHLPESRGWHPGRVLETWGWECVDHTGRVRVWRRERVAGLERASLLLCAYRSVSTEALSSIMAVCAGGGHAWRLKVKSGDAMIARSRSILVTDWWRGCADDVFLMVDDDVVFSSADADRVVSLCRSGLPIVCGAYPVHNGAHFACRTALGTGMLSFGPSQDAVEIVYAATGFMAVHRRVIDALVATLPLCHAAEEWSFYPLFQQLLIDNEAAGGLEWLSEDWGFSELARRAGFSVWLDPQTVLTHMGSAGISVRNMGAMHAAITQV